MYVDGYQVVNTKSDSELEAPGLAVSRPPIMIKKEILYGGFVFICLWPGGSSNMGWSFRGVNPTISGKAFGCDEFKSLRCLKGETRDKISKIMFMYVHVIGIHGYGFSCFLCPFGQCPGSVMWATKDCLLQIGGAPRCSWSQGHVRMKNRIHPHLPVSTFWCYGRIRSLMVSIPRKPLSQLSGNTQTHTLRGRLENASSKSFQASKCGPACLQDLPRGIMELVVGTDIEWSFYLQFFSSNLKRQWNTSSQTHGRRPDCCWLPVQAPANAAYVTWTGSGSVSGSVGRVSGFVFCIW